MPKIKLSLASEIARQRTQLHKAFQAGLYDAGTSLAHDGAASIVANPPKTKYEVAYNNGMAYALQVYKLLQLASGTIPPDIDWK